MQLPEEATRIAETYHSKMAKVFQGLPDQACNVGAVAGMGWLSFCGYVEMIRLQYFMRIISLQTKCIYKRLFILRYCYHMYHDDGAHIGPVSVFIDLCRKYDLLSKVKSAVEDSVIPSKYEWKKVVKHKIWEFENRQWKVVSKMYSTLNTVRCILPNVQLLSWWEYVQANPTDTRKCRTVIKLLFDCHRLKSCLYRYKDNGINDPYCEYCDSRAIEDVQHIMFRCPENNDLRQELWKKIMEACPVTLYEDIMAMTISDKTTLFLSGLGNVYTQEWTPVYHAIAEYVHKIYYSRIMIQATD
jgi:hypothetical protein